MLRSYRVAFAALLVTSLLIPIHKAKAAEPPNSSAALVRIPGHVLPALSKATVVPAPNSSSAAKEPITLTIVLRRDNQAAFQRYLREIYDPHSKNFHHYLTQRQIADRFGPSRASYGAMLAYLCAAGFRLVEGSRNRLTITVSGTRGVVERAFDVRIADYKIGDRNFFANQSDPALPASLAKNTQTVIGLSDLAEVQRPKSALILNAPSYYANCYNNPAAGTLWYPSKAQCLQDYTNAVSSYNAYCGQFWGLFGALLHAINSGLCVTLPSTPASPMVKTKTKVAHSTAAVDGTGQKIGLLEFDSYNTSDVANFLALTSGSSSQIGNLSEVQVNGGAPIGSGEDEVLLDIDTVMTIAPGAQVVVYSAPFSGAGSSFQAVLNKMINDNVTIISNSWAYCEDQTTAANVDSIDTIFQNAAAAGISVFNGAGDTGSTCLDGSANTVAVPSDSPNATAVGGTSLIPGSAGTYQSETWWNGANAVPPTGTGGYGTSKFFSAANYQQVLFGSSNRSVPDVAVSADPDTNGLPLCQADNGGCPSGLLYGGTSAAAPIMAGMSALLNQAQGKNLGLLNPSLYSLANTNAFHSAASMGSDYAHVGLGSPDLSALNLALSGASPGTPTAANSVFIINPSSVGADGTTTASVLVQLRDANDNSVSGKNVTLVANSGSATILPASGTSTGNNGTVSFTVKDLNTETVPLTATDTTDGIVLTQQPAVTFVVPLAASAALSAFPTSVTADGASPTDITVTLEDTLGRPSPGKLIQIVQSGGNSVISGPNPPVTNSSGQIQFTAVDSNNETITYSATDVTDGNLPFPETAQVTFSNAPEAGCSNGNITPAPGFEVTPYVTGLVAENYAYGGFVSAGGCTGAAALAFDSSGNLYVSDAPTGNIYKIPPGGGAASAANLLGTTQPGIGQLIYDDGELFAAQGATTGNAFTGGVVEVDPSTGDEIGTIATPIPCAQSMAVDPLSGDLFVNDACNGSAANSSLFRISDPTGTSPVLSTYATLPGVANYQISFAPDGTIYAVGGLNFSEGYAGQIYEIGGTNTTQPATVTTLSGPAPASEMLLASGSNPNGGANFLFFNTDVGTASVNELATLDLTTNPPSTSTVLVNSGLGEPQIDLAIIGPDGCLYAAAGDAVFRITDTTGACNYTSTIASPSLVLSPTGITPNPAQGSSQTLTANFHYVIAPAGTPVNFAIAGANPQIASANTNASGQASFTYTAVHQGVDTITATATIAGSPISSNQSVITWGPGSDVTFLSLNPSPTSGTQSQSVNLVASLTDTSSSPAVPLAGQSISFTLGGSTCGGMTNASGIATCAANTGSIGTKTLSASFAGTSQYVASSASTGFNVIAPASTSTPTPTATPTPVAGKLRVSPKRLNFGTVDVGSSKVKSVKITNLGKITKKKHPVPILIESESGAASPFSISQACDDDDLGPRSKGVKPGTCEVSVTFTPSAETKYEGTLMIKDNLEPGFGQSVALKGAGKTPK